MPTHPAMIAVPPEDASLRLDQFLTRHLTDVSRARVQQLITQAQVLVDEKPAKPSLRLHGGERIRILGPAQRVPLRAVPEDVPLDVVYEDSDLAVVNKPAGMMVHVGAGGEDRNRGTLVNALLHRFARLSEVSGELRPGIVHRLDKATSGLMVVARNDPTHRKLAAQFARRQVKKTYLALVHGWLRPDYGTIAASISRDAVRRTRMTTRRAGGREAITHYRVRQRIDSPFGKFSLLEVKIDTGRTHQIRVHFASLRHPVVGDALYGAPRRIQGRSQKSISLARNFLHAAALAFDHPATGEPLSFACPLPPELDAFLKQLVPTQGA
ncbi:MAG TPA: RluA family pseudouridine synthase [Terriglobales bacterium]|nr:RluA family pseudouridine synthase [Terriglobales bacterium]